MSGDNNQQDNNISSNFSNINSFPPQPDINNAQSSTRESSNINYDNLANEVSSALNSAPTQSNINQESSAEPQLNEVSSSNATSTGGGFSSFQSNANQFGDNYVLPTGSNAPNGAYIYRQGNSSNNSASVNTTNNTNTAPVFNQVDTVNMNGNNNGISQTPPPVPPSRVTNNLSSSADDDNPYVYIDKISNPSRFYAIPLIGMIFKCFALIPVFIFWYILALLVFATVFIGNPFFVLFNGKYWEEAYKLYIYFIRYQVKIYYYLFGLSNNYPMFDDKFKDPSAVVNIDYPEIVNRLWAIPIGGIIGRYIFLIPYSLFSYTLMYAAYLSTTLIASFSVLFMGVYPQSMYELGLDAIRVNIRLSTWAMGLTDNLPYPSFRINMNNLALKLIFIILGALFAIYSFIYNFSRPHNITGYNNTDLNSSTTNNTLPGY